MRIGWIIIAIVAAIAIYAIAIFNRLVRLRNMVREGFSGIDVQLRRRTDLVPNLVETVKAYAAHERDVLEEVAATRASSIAANDVPGQAAAARALQAALGRLFALAEAYPQLKADKNFLELQNQLAEIEDQLQMARRYYNGTVRDLTSRSSRFRARSSPVQCILHRRHSSSSMMWRALRRRSRLQRANHEPSAPREPRSHPAAGVAGAGVGERAHHPLHQRCGGRAQR
jgi:LemA protein